ncbi:Flp pilus assembly protein CpaB [Gottfriedia acidiceleris]|uniref:Flp pilus assembly protein CpaB n=1 Tax=Gottfriedia acidiceleris TaxID=371036 RepID=UPI00101DA176|nr:RcpC/CpaB family pilus assembly protein [Gottfriedia acidiceleris]
MNTKRIWIYSLIFGLLTALVLYIAVFSNTATPTTVKETKKPVVKANIQTAKATEKKIQKREIKNEMIPVSEGKRAISLKVDLEQGISGYVEPNSMVDIIAYETNIDQKTKKEFRSAILGFQNIKVLASGKASDSNDEALNYETITVEVTPEQGLELSLASKDKNGFYFMLRNVKDNKEETKDVRVTREVVKGEDE